MIQCSGCGTKLNGGIKRFLCPACEARYGKDRSTWPAWLSGITEFDLKTRRGDIRFEKHSLQLFKDCVVEED